MNADEIKHRFNLVGMIAALGAVIALIGILIAYTENPDTVKMFDIVVFVMMAIVGLLNIRPSINVNMSTFQTVLAFLSVVVTSLIYINISTAVDAQSFMDVGYGIWIVFIGAILFTVFSISDLMYKRKQ